MRMIAQRTLLTDDVPFGVADLDRRVPMGALTRAQHDEKGTEEIDQRSLQAITPWLFMDSRLVRIFCANSPSQKAREESYNLLLLLRKYCLFCHRSECYGLPSPSISLESIKSLTLSVGTSTITLTPTLIEIKGPLVKINC